MGKKKLLRKWDQWREDVTLKFKLTFFDKRLICCSKICFFENQMVSNLGPICYRCLNNSFKYLNNITHIFTHFFI